MMRTFLAIFILVLSLQGFEIAYDKGEKEGQTFAVLHLMNKSPFTCAFVKEDNSSFYKCKVTGYTSFALKNRKFKEFDLAFKRASKNIYIYIYPKNDVKMYSFNVLHKDNIVYAQNQNLSKHYSFIFSSELKYMKQYEGLNFNVIFDKLKTPSIGALDLNSQPLILPRSADVNTYLNIKKNFDKGDYKLVLRDTTKALKRYKGSIFSSEFALYKLRAMNEIYTNSFDKNYKALDEMLADTKAWRREHPNDVNFPEVMYYTMRAYIALAQKSNAKYAMNILKTEHFDSYYSQLARLDYTDYTNRLKRIDKNLQPYVDIYYDTKYKDIASRAAITLAINYFLQKRVKSALRFTKIVLNNNLPYLQKDKKRTLALSELLDKNGYYDLSAKAYEILFYSLSKVDKEYESVLKNLSMVLMRAKKYSQAKNYLNYYLQEYPQGAYVKLVKEALDKIFLDTSDKDIKDLHARYAALIKKYAGPVAFKALSKDVELYYKQQNYPAVINYKKLIEKYKSKKLDELLKNAAIKEIDIALKADLCPHAIKTLKLFKPYKIDNEIEDKKAMLKCLMSTQNIDLAKIYIARNYNSDKIYYGLKAAKMALNDQSYKKAVKEAKEVLNQRLIKTKAEIDEAKRILFLGLLKSGEYNKAMLLLDQIKTEPMSFPLLELYNDFIAYARAKSMTISILNFAPRAIDYQNYKGDNIFSPELEFTYLDALKKTKDSKKALAVLRDLIQLKLSDANMARAYYLYSYFYLEQKDDEKSKLWLLKCKGLKKDSDWKSLCIQKLELKK